MPFELGEAFNGGAEWLCGSTAAYGILKNPVFVSLLITALALVIIFVTYRQDLKGTGWRRGFKAAFWLTIGVSALVFVHYYALERSLRKNSATQGVRSVMDSIHYSSTVGGYNVIEASNASAQAVARAPLVEAPKIPAQKTGGGKSSDGASDVSDLGLTEVVLSTEVA